MDPTLGVMLLWLLFGGTHVGLAARPSRTGLASVLGERGFAGVYWLVAAITFTVLVHYYAVHRFEGAPGLALGAEPLVRWLLMAIIVTGMALIAAGLMAYPRLPMAVFNQRVPPPRGIERITRHPFFVGTAMLALAHALLASRLIGALFMGGFAVLTVAGAWHQDRKLLALRGRPYADYLAATSILPFGAVLAGRQRIVWRELPLRTLAAGVLAALALRGVHGAIFDHGGAWVIGALLGGAGMAALSSWRRSRGVRAREAQVAA